MVWLRSFVFQVLFYAWTATLGILTLPALILPRPVPRGVGRLWVDGTFWLLRNTVGLNYRIEGQPLADGTPALYAIKHQSAWDTLVLMRLFRDPAIVMKRELLWLPLVGWYLGRLGMIAIDRKAGSAALRAMLRDAKARIGEGRDVVVFPEGTRTRPGEDRPYQPGTAALYATLGVPVVPVALNSGLFWPRRAFSKKPGVIGVSFAPAIAPGLDRATFMETLKTAIEAETKRLAGAPDLADMNDISTTYGQNRTSDSDRIA